MASRDFQLPDDFPDMTLPERSGQAAEPLRPLGSPAAPSWHEGDRVLAPWEPDFLYAGEIRQIKGNQALIQFGDGDAGWVGLGQLRPFVVQAGQKVLSRRKMGPYFIPAEVVEVNHEDVRVAFEDDKEE